MYMHDWTGQFPTALYWGGKALKLSTFFSSQSFHCWSATGLRSDVSGLKDWSYLMKITGNWFISKHMVWILLESDSDNAHHTTKQRRLNWLLKGRYVICVYYCTPVVPDKIHAMLSTTSPSVNTDVKKLWNVHKRQHSTHAMLSNYLKQCLDNLWILPGRTK
jgi:hypothetical protein